MPTYTIDTGNLNVFFKDKRYPEIVDLKTQAEPTARAMLARHMGGSPAAARKIEDFASAVKNPSINPKEMPLPGTFFLEVPVEYLKVGGTINGSGTQTISNAPADRTATARYTMNRKYTPVSVNQDDYLNSMRGESEGAVFNQVTNLLGFEIEGGFKAHLEAYSIDMFSTNTDEENGWIGFDAGIGTSASDTTTYAAISRSTITAWRGNYGTLSLASVTNPLSTDYLYTKIGDYIDTLTDNGAMQENLMIIMGTGLHAKWRQILSNLPSSAGIAGHGGRMNLGKGEGVVYSALSYNGIPIVRDRRAGTNDMVIVDMESTFPASSVMFHLDSWHLSEGQTKEFTRIASISQLCVTHPRRNYNVVAS